MESLRGKVAIVGAADTEVGVVPHMSATHLCVDAALRALADAGISKNEVDGLITCNSMAEPFMYHAEAIAEYMQIFPPLLHECRNRRWNDFFDPSTCCIRNFNRRLRDCFNYDG